MKTNKRDRTRRKLFPWLKPRIEIIADFALVFGIGAGLWFLFMSVNHLNSMHDLVALFGDDWHVLLALILANLLPELGLLFIGVGIMAVIAGKWKMPLSDIGMTKPAIPLLELTALLALAFGGVLVFDVLSNLIA